MFKNSYQSGLLSIFFSCGANPLAIWDIEVHNGHIKRLMDKDVSSVVLELISTNVTTTYIVCPKNNQSLGIRLPFLVMIVKDLKRYFTFEITIMDDKNMRRRFRISNFATTTKILPFCTTMPIGLTGGWNQIQFNLSDFTKRAYGSGYVETTKVQVNANTRLRRIYFSDRLYADEELPQDYKLFLPVDRKKGKKGKEKEEPPKQAPTQEKIVTLVAKKPASSEIEDQQAADALVPVEAPKAEEKAEAVDVARKEVPKSESGASEAVDEGGEAQTEGEPTDESRVEESEEPTSDIAAEETPEQAKPESETPVEAETPAEATTEPEEQEASVE